MIIIQNPDVHSFDPTVLAHQVKFDFLSFNLGRRHFFALNMHHAVRFHLAFHMAHLARFFIDERASFRNHDSIANKTFRFQFVLALCRS